MDTIFMNSENSKISNPHRLLLNLEETINQRGMINFNYLKDHCMYQILKTFSVHDQKT